MTSHYTLGGKGHRILRRLAAGPASATDLRDDLAINDAPKSLDRLRRLLAALTSDLLIVHGCGVYRLREPGAAMLETLDLDLAAQSNVSVPSVRVFVDRRMA